MLMETIALARKELGRDEGKAVKPPKDSPVAQDISKQHRRLLDIAWKMYDITSEMSYLKSDVACLASKVCSLEVGGEVDASPDQGNKMETEEGHPLVRPEECPDIKELFSELCKGSKVGEKEQDSMSMDDLSFSIFKEIVSKVTAECVGRIMAAQKEAEVHRVQESRDCKDYLPREFGNGRDLEDKVGKLKYLNYSSDIKTDFRSSRENVPMRHYRGEKDVVGDKANRLSYYQFGREGENDQEELAHLKYGGSREKDIKDKLEELQKKWGYKGDKDNDTKDNKQCYLKFGSDRKKDSRDKTAGWSANWKYTSDDVGGRGLLRSSSPDLEGHSEKDYDWQYFDAWKKDIPSPSKKHVSFRRHSSNTDDGSGGEDAFFSKLNDSLYFHRSHLSPVQNIRLKSKRDNSPSRRSPAFSTDGSDIL